MTFDDAMKLSSGTHVVVATTGRGESFSGYITFPTFSDGEGFRLDRVSPDHGRCGWRWFDRYQVGDVRATTSA